MVVAASTDVPDAPPLGSMTTADQRLLLVHAHPDDETIGQGATMAKLRRRGRSVTLVTCTGGEMGEILVPSSSTSPPTVRTGSASTAARLAAAMKELGVSDHRYLGGFGTYRDSGMRRHEDGHAVAADPPEDGQGHENAFWHATTSPGGQPPGHGHPGGAAAGAGHLRPVRRLRPPHIQAHRVATYAASLAAVPSHRKDLGEAWEISKVYWAPCRRPDACLRALREAGDTTSFEGHGPRRSATPLRHRRRDLAAVVDATAYVERKMAAMGAHATQISWTARSSRCPTTRATSRGAWSSTGSPGRAAGESTRTVSRPTSSPGSDGSRVRVLAAPRPAPGRRRHRHRDGGCTTCGGAWPSARWPRSSPRWHCHRLVDPPRLRRGWVLVVGWLTFPAPRGDYVISQDVRVRRPGARPRPAGARDRDPAAAGGASLTRPAAGTFSATWSCAGPCRDLIPARRSEARLPSSSAGPGASARPRHGDGPRPAVRRPGVAR